MKSLKTYLIFLYFIAENICFGAGIGDFYAVPRFYNLKENDVSTKQKIINGLTAIGKLPIDKIEDELVYSLNKSRDGNEGGLGESLNVILLCGIVFKFDKLPVSEALSKVRPHGLFFFSDNPIPSGETVECILPLYIDRNGNFDIRYFFGGYTGPNISPNFGLEYFRYCRKNYALRGNK